MPVVFCFSDNGWLKQEHWQPLMETFIARKNVLWPDRNICLLLDNLDLHHDVDTAVMLQASGIHVAFFPPNATYFMQPCDDKVFADLKKRIVNRVNKEAIFTTSTRTDMGQHLFETAQKEVQKLSEAVI